MQSPALIFENSPFFLILCLLAGVVYALLLYRRSGPWGSGPNKLLFALRMLAVALIAALLLSPILRQVRNVVEEPVLVFAVDNSSSIAEVVDSTKLENLTRQLSKIATEAAKSYGIEYRSFSTDQLEEFPRKINYNARSTNLHKLINDVRIDYEGRNLSGIVLISDGIYNQGVSPTFSDYNFNIYTVGVGDTVPKSDLSITSLVYNKISYQGNKFPLVAQISHTGFSGQSVRVSVVKGGKVLDQQVIKAGNDNQVTDVEFSIEAKEKGYQRYQVLVEKKEGEFTHSNNVQQAFIEIIEGKEQIAIIAPAPHPDIKAVRAAVESNANYALDQYILSFNEDARKLTATKKKYDLIILHQIPDRSKRANAYLQKLSTDETSLLFFYGGQTDMRSFNAYNKVLTVDALPTEYDKVSAVFNQGFTSFKLSDELQQAMDEFPPIDVPFGEIALSGRADVLLYQQVGNVATTKPLIAVMTERGYKQGVILAEGLWLWKLNNYARTGNHDTFNELLSKLVQYLSSKEDKRKFRAYPVKNEFLTNEKVIFDTEVYNDLYERVYGNKIDLSITDGEGRKSNYSYVTNERNTRYTISGLSEGVYKYSASTLLGGKRETVTGEFLVKELQVEQLNLTADFGMLRNIAENTGGEFFRADQLQELEEELTKKRTAQGIIHSGERYLPFIHLKWLFFLLVALLTAEWFIRKYNGGY